MGTVDLTPEGLEANRLFNQYCYPKSHHWNYEPRKQAAFSMLRSGIFGDNVLKGHARHKKTYQVELGALIYELVNVYRGHSYIPPISYLKEDILHEFDHHFSYIFMMAQLAGVRKDVLGNYWDAWKKELSDTVDNGEIPPHWRTLIEEKIFQGRSYRPPKMAHEFADIFLAHCLLARPSKVADWERAIFTSLGLKPPSKSSLSNYVKQRQKEEQERITAAGEDINNYQKKGIQIRY